LALEGAAKTDPSIQRTCINARALVAQ